MKKRFGPGAGGFGLATRLWGCWIAVALAGTGAGAAVVLAAGVGVGVAVAAGGTAVALGVTVALALEAGASPGGGGGVRACRARKTPNEPKTIRAPTMGPAQSGMLFWSASRTVRCMGAGVPETWRFQGRVSRSANSRLSRAAAESSGAIGAVSVSGGGGRV